MFIFTNHQAVRLRNTENVWVIITKHASKKGKILPLRRKDVPEYSQSLRGQRLPFLRELSAKLTEGSPWQSPKQGIPRFRRDDHWSSENDGRRIRWRPQTERKSICDTGRATLVPTTTFHSRSARPPTPAVIARERPSDRGNPCSGA